MTQKLLKPTNDYVFKRIFGYVGNEEITKDFLNAIMDEEVTKVKLDCKEILEKDLQDDKFGILDIKAEINDGIQCDIEMQVVDYKDIENRLLYYWSKMYTQSIRMGEQYNLLKKTVIVLISNYEIERLENLQKTLSKWQIREAEEGKLVLTEMLEFYIIELPKVKKYGIKNEEIKTWVKFIESPEVLSMGELERNKALQKAKEELELISADEKEQYLAEKRFLYMMDKKAIEAAGFDKGMKAGIEKGKEEEKEKIARELLKLGVSLEKIERATGLTQEEIKKIK